MSEKEEIELDQAMELWNSPAPDMSSKQIDRAFSNMDGFISRNRLRSRIRTGLACCAVVVISLVSGMVVRLIDTTQSPTAPETMFTEYVAQTGTTKKVILPDSTIVHLNAQSRLFSSIDFNGPTREVFLCGEGFFEVARDPDHPFIVHAAGNSIKATGTKFNVRAFLDERSSTTTLLEGGVEVTIPGQSGPIALTPGHALSVCDDNSEVTLYKVDPKNTVGWYNGEFNAFHMSLSQICRDLERRFDVKIMIANKNVASKIFYASFVNNEDVEMILHALNMQHDFRIRKQDEFYTIY